MAVRSLQLFAATGSTTLTAVYTCPAGKTAIFKRWSIGKFATGAVVLTITVLRGATAYGVVRYSFPLASTVDSLEDWLVIEPGDVIRLQTDTNTATVWASGAELEGVA